MDLDTFKLIDIDTKSEFLENVKALGDKNSKTLGFLAEPVYDEYANKGGIIGVIYDDKQLAGYLMYARVKTKGYFKIVHLCLSEEFRGNRLADLLFDELKERSKTYKGIGLSCRRDDSYKYANQLWQRLGFVPNNERRGRGKKETYLTWWWYDHHPQTLFDFGNTEKIKAVMDACVFFDLNASKPNHAERESLSLIDDSLYPEMELYITPELKYEINRMDKAHELRKRNFDRARNYLEATGDSEQFQQIYSNLLKDYFDPQSDNDKSDIKHIAWAIVDPSIDFFITRDEELLARSNKIFETYNLSIQHPIDMVLHIHEYLYFDDYRNMKLAGTHIEQRKVKSGEQNILADNFRYSESGERKSDFLSKIRPLLVDRENLAAYVVENIAGKKLAFFIYDRSEKTELKIPIFRVNESALDDNLIRYLILRFVEISASEKRYITRITEKLLHDKILTVLQSDTFIRSEKSWMKLNLPIAGNTHEVASLLEQALGNDQKAKAYYQIHTSLLNDEGGYKNWEAMSEIERIFWPVKILNADISTLTIPINVDWAALWFDEGLAQNTLWGAKKERAFNREGVYYSTSTNKNYKTPGRIMWYVTKHKNQVGSASIRACSRLDDIVIGTAKSLFRQFQHLGIYEWADLYRLVDGDENKEITAFRFSDTQLLPHPVSYQRWKKVTQELRGSAPPIYSPSLMPKEIFEEIYKMAVIED